VDSDIHRWIMQRNGWQNTSELEQFLSSKTRILDAGCGNGRVTALLRTHSDPQCSKVIGLDLTSYDIARENLRGFSNVEVARHDLTQSLAAFGTFDFIYCQEVLHHTRDPELSFSNLVDSLTKGGVIAIYVYKKKAVIREFVDDYVREKVASLPYEDAIKICRQFTNFGKALSELNVTVDVPPLDILGIPGGRQDIQRLIYNFMFKCFWNKNLSMEENDAINFDWYHPQICFRYEMDEVLDWFKRKNLKVIRSYEDFYGITVWGERQLK
jgi:SAM-dependent methyltransferase